MAIFLKALCGCIALFPLRILRGMGVVIGHIIWLFPSLRRVTEQNISLCFPTLTKREKSQLIRQALIESGKYSLENCFIWHRSFQNNQKYILESEGLELLEQETPTILLTPHFGGFEITGRVISLTRPMHFLYRKAKHPKVEQLIFQYRNQHNLYLHATDRAGIKHITRALQTNGLIGILPDQSPNGSYVRTSFMGVPTNTTTLLCKLALKYQANVLLTYALRIPGGYKLVVKQVDIHAATVEESAQKMQDIIADLVMQYPQQYLWNYKKFKQTFSYRDNKFKGES